MKPRDVVTVFQQSRPLSPGIVVAVTDMDGALPILDVLVPAGELGQVWRGLNPEHTDLQLAYSWGPYSPDDFAAPEAATDGAGVEAETHPPA
jgi:hypothetical protein